MQGGERVPAVDQDGRRTDEPAIFGLGQRADNRLIANEGVGGVGGAADPGASPPAVRVEVFRGWEFSRCRPGRPRHARRYLRLPRCDDLLPPGRAGCRGDRATSRAGAGGPRLPGRRCGSGRPWCRRCRCCGRPSSSGVIGWMRSWVPPSTAARANWPVCLGRPRPVRDHDATDEPRSPDRQGGTTEQLSNHQVLGVDTQLAHDPGRPAIPEVPERPRSHQRVAEDHPIGCTAISTCPTPQCDRGRQRVR